MSYDAQYDDIFSKPLNLRKVTPKPDPSAQAQVRPAGHGPRGLGQGLGGGLLPFLLAGRRQRAPRSRAAGLLPLLTRRAGWRRRARHSNAARRCSSHPLPPRSSLPLLPCLPCPRCPERARSPSATSTASRARGCSGTDSLPPRQARRQLGRAGLGRAGPGQQRADHARRAEHPSCLPCFPCSSPARFVWPLAARPLCRPSPLTLTRSPSLPLPPLPALPPTGQGVPRLHGVCARGRPAGALLLLLGPRGRVCAHVLHHRLPGHHAVLPPPAHPPLLHHPQVAGVRVCLLRSHVGAGRPA